MPTGPGRFAPLDGLRGLAILSIMAFHTSGQWLSGGFASLDLFFVLSGYLMVGILTDEGSSRLTTSLGAFYLRRFRRLAPALLTVVLVVVIMQLFVLAQRPATWRGDVIAALTYTTNWWAQLTDVEYFNHWRDPSPLLQTWSLAVEEQFYLLLPIALLVLFRLGVRGRGLAVAFGAGALASAVWSLVSTADPLRIYFGTDTRMQALLLGAVMGVLCRRPARIQDVPATDWRQFLGWLSLGAFVLLMYFGRPWDQHFDVWMLPVSSVLSAVLLWAVIDTPASALAKMFAWKPLAWFGTISYALYLWHWPLFLWIQSGEDAGIGAQLWSIALAILLGWATTRFIEMRIRVGSFSRWPVRRQWLSYLAAVVGIAALTLLPFQRNPAAGPAEGSWPASSRLPPTLGIFGDSTAYTATLAFPAARYDQMSVRSETPLGCGLRESRLFAEGLDPANPQCDGWQQRWREVMAEAQPAATILMEGIWELHDVVDNGTAYPPGSPQYNQVVEGVLNEAVDIVTPAGGGPVYVIGVPCLAPNTPGYKKVLSDPARWAVVNDILRRVVAAHPQARFVDMAPLTCDAAGGTVNEVDGVTLRPDGVHWDASGGAYFWSYVLDRIQVRETP